MPGILERLISGQQFAMLAVGNVHADIKAETQLRNGTWVLQSVPTMLGKHWAEWIGSMRADRLHNANVVFVNQHKFPQYLNRVIFMLRLGGVIEYEEAELITGMVTEDGLTVREMGRLPSFRNTKGYVRNPIDLPRIEQALARTDAFCQIELMVKGGSFLRLMRGINVLKDGLLTEFGQERIHQFVRSLEALILPETGRTRKTFIHRCQTLAVRCRSSEMVLAESFDMRSDTEHLQDWQRALRSHPTVDRENIALHRTRQMEKLASFAYGRILDNRSLWPHFTDDSGQSAFWKLSDQQRKASWGTPLDLDTVPFVHKYDGRNRAL